MDQGQELALALVSANLLSKTPEIYGKSPDEDAERSFEHLIDVALTEAPAGVVRELARFAGTASDARRRRIRRCRIRRHHQLTRACSRAVPLGGIRQHEDIQACEQEQEEREQWRVAVRNL